MGQFTMRENTVKQLFLSSLHAAFPQVKHSHDTLRSAALLLKDMQE